MSALPPVKGPATQKEGEDIPHTGPPVSLRGPLPPLVTDKSESQLEVGMRPDGPLDEGVLAVFDVSILPHIRHQK